MLKKAGIVLATATVGLLSVSPLAFANESEADASYSHEETEILSDNFNDNNIANVSGNNVNVPINACDFQVPVNVLGVQVPVNDVEVLADLSGALGLGLLGPATAANEDAGTNVQDDSCSNEVESSAVGVVD